jgi:starch phosphorylase
MKHAMRVAGLHFTARRMLESYARMFYVQAVQGTTLPDDPPTA